MKNKTKIIAVAVCSIFAATLFAFSANAQKLTELDKKNAVERKGEIIADVTIYNVKLVGQTEANLTIEFSLRNDMEIQSGIKYAVQLVQLIKEGGSTLVDQKVYDDEIVLQEGETRQIKINYAPPKFLKGDYMLGIRAMNNSGVPLAWGTLGKISLNGKGNQIFISQNSCYLTIENDSQPKRYSLSQGVDVKPEENLLLHCPVENIFSNDMKVNPQFATYYRTVFGKLMSKKKLNSILLKKEEKSEQVFVIPKESSPQAYDAVLILKDGSGNDVSQEVIAHYVIQGESATIQDVRFDKNIYESGEKAKVFFLYSGSATNFPNSRAGETHDRLKVSITIKNNEGKDCATLFQSNLDEYVVANTFEISITAKCQNPTADVTITNADGKILAQGTFVTYQAGVKKGEAKNEEAKKKGLFPEKFGTILGEVLIAISMLIIIIVFFLRKKQSKGIKIVIFLGILFLLIPFGSTKAATLKVDACDVGKCQFYQYFDFGFLTLDESGKPNYHPGQWIELYGYASQYNVCLNTLKMTELSAIIDDDYHQLAEYKYDENRTIVDSSFYLCGLWSILGDEHCGQFQVPEDVGSYNAEFDAYMYDYTTGEGLITRILSKTLVGHVTAYLPYDVHIDGWCGYATARTYYNAPTYDLCSQGTPTAVSGSNGQWAWQCLGEGNGSTPMSCAASICGGPIYTNTCYITQPAACTIATAGTTINGAVRCYNDEIACYDLNGQGNVALSNCLPPPDCVLPIPRSCQPATYTYSCDIPTPDCSDVADAGKSKTGAAPICTKSQTNPTYPLTSVTVTTSSCGSTCVAATTTCPPAVFGSTGWKEVAP